MPHVDFDFNKDFKEIVQQGLSQSQFQLLKELFDKHQINEDQLYYIMNKNPKAIGFKKGDHVLYMGYTHLRPDHTEFKVYEVVQLHVDCLTDVTIKPVDGKTSKRVYHRDLVKIKK